jgi:hypothetical protein
MREVGCTRFKWPPGERHRSGFIQHTIELGGGTDSLPWMVANDPYRGWFTVALVSCRLLR